MATKLMNRWMMLISISLLGSLSTYGSDGGRILAFATLDANLSWTVWVFNDSEVEVEVASYELFVRGAPDKEGRIESVVHSPRRPEVIKPGQFIGVFGFKARSNDLEYGPRMLRLRLPDRTVRDVPVIVESELTPTGT